MFPDRRTILPLLPLTLLMLIPVFEALAQRDYPNRPVEITIPVAPGGPLDLAARFFSDKWAEFLHQPVVIANKGGSGGVIGARYVAQAKPDGYKILASGDSHIVTSRLGRSDAGYDLDSFEALFTYSKITLFFSVKGDSRWKTLHDLVKDAKSNPGKFKYATTGIGSTQHMVTELFCKAAGIKMTVIPFKSSPENLTALAGGNVDLAATFNLSGMDKSGLIRVLAVSDEERLAEYPDVPTLKELAYSVPYTSQYNGLVIPGKTPENIVAKWIDVNNNVWKKYDKEIKDKLPKMDIYPALISGKAWMRMLKEREKLFRDFIAQTGIKVE